MECSILVCLMLSFQLLIGQNVKELGEGNNMYFNRAEIAYLDSILGDKTEYGGLKILFVHGDKKNPVITKVRFFNDYIIPFEVKGQLPKFSIKPLTEDEKNQYLGYDVLLMTHDAIDGKRLITFLEKSK